MNLHLILHHIKSYIAPCKCGICGKNLLDTEYLICLRCSTQIVNCESKDDRESITARLFWGIAPIERGGVLFAYQADAPISNLFANIKYHKQVKLCHQLGYVLGRFYLQRDFFDGIDCIIPVPLSKQRMKQRGYNQSYEIAFGIQRATQIPIDNKSVIRSFNNDTQTHLTSTERMKNVEGIFHVLKPENLDGKHLLIVDDVITTGATVGSLIRTIYEIAPRCTFSILALGRGGDMRE